MKIFDILRRRTCRKKAGARGAENQGPEEEVEIRRQKLALLTGREKECLLLLLKGHTMKETAKLMGVTLPTINTHTNSIHKKLGVKSRAQLIIQYRDLAEEGTKK
ncbi:response regulator transcription factor [Leadbettera azotonutricia]|uniref:response regulator transcription factor n=1 Tax=Leadbettera azotonutricia TaxID=150829 RepID=UPI0005C6516F|nr:helix-turn-helix transcriptional regulator [Leadbettera azotonutricia]